MGFTNQETSQQFPFPADIVFENLGPALQQAGFKIGEADPFIRRVTASAPLSLFSWGENIAVTVTALSAYNSSVTISSSLKFGASYTGTHRNQKNIDAAIRAISKALQATKEASSATASYPLPADDRASAPQGPKRVRGFNHRGVRIDEFDNGSFIVHLPDGPVPLPDRTATDAFLKRLNS